MDFMSSSTDQDLEPVEVIGDLLEEGWFFDNLFTRRSRVLRYCHSDPFPSSCSSSSSLSPSSPSPAGNLASEKIPEASAGRGLIRAPSLPPCIETRESGGETEKVIGKLTRQLSEKGRAGLSYLLNKEEEGGGRRRESGMVRPSSSSATTGGGLQRTQTLPSYIGREENDEFHDHDGDARLGFLIREALASSASEFTTPPSSIVSSKVSCIIPRHRPPRNSRSEESIAEIITQRNPNPRTLRKTLSNIEPEEILKMKNPEISSKQRTIVKGRKGVEPRAAPRKGRCSSAVPPIPPWVPKESNRDMKAQIKFWARAVASNVRQEC